MIDINKKIEKIEKNCLDTAKKELYLLKSENDKISENKILEKVNNYKIELDKKYQEEINKLKREFNKNIFNYEMNGKKEIGEIRKQLIKKIENEIVERFKSFVNTPEYEDFLNRSMPLEMRFENNEYVVCITENDYNKYYQKFLHYKTYSDSNISLEKISNDYIGGCIILDKTNKISIDNTIRTNISQKVEEINI